MSQKNVVDRTELVRWSKTNHLTRDIIEINNLMRRPGHELSVEEMGAGGRRLLLDGLEIGRRPDLRALFKD